MVSFCDCLMPLLPRQSSTIASKDNQSKNKSVKRGFLLNWGIRRMAENGFAPPLGNFADISYLVEN